MNMKDRFFRSLFAVMWVALLVAPAFASDDSYDWPRFRGVEGDGISPETGLLESWPEGGPQPTWKKEFGSAFSGITIARGRLFTMGQDGEKGKQYVLAVDPQSGGELWRADLDEPFESEFGKGPSSTPIVEGDTVYALGARGTLAALSAAEGKLLWKVNFIELFESPQPRWGFSNSPVIVGNTVIVEVAGGEGECFAGFDKTTGKKVWAVQDGDAGGYMTPTMVTLGGVTQVVAVRGLSKKVEVVSVDEKGGLLWAHEFAQGTMTISSPVFIAPDRFLISATGKGGALMLRVKHEGGAFSTEEVWRSQRFKNHYSTSIYHEGFIYGFDNALLKCIDAGSGEQKWVKRGFGKGSLIMAEGRLYVLSDRGVLALVEATSESYKETSRFQALTGKSWTAPAISGGRIYLRNLEQMASYPIKKKVAVQ